MAARTLFMYDEGMLLLEVTLAPRSKTFRFNAETSLLSPTLLLPTAADDEIAAEVIACERMADVIFDCWSPEATGSPPIIRGKLRNV